MTRNSSRRRLMGTTVLVLMAAATATAAPMPRKIVALLDGTQNFGTTRRAVSFYDVTDLSGGSVFNQTPLFSVWTGWEISDPNFPTAGNFEDPTSITVNPVNGTIYLSAFDSGPAGVPEPGGDTQGVADLYRIDYQEILDDFVTNSRPVGTMYAPTTGPDGGVNFDHPDHIGTTQFIDNAITKVGELARAQSVTFFDPDLEFVDPATMIYLDNEEGPVGDDFQSNDHTLRVWNRVSTSNGAATTFGTNEGGYNGQTAESWESTNGGILAMDGVGRSEPEDIAFVRRLGTNGLVEGVWVSETDGGSVPTDPNNPVGDNTSFFELDRGTNAFTKKELQIGAGSPFPTGITLDEDPVGNPTGQGGSHDFTLVDGAGNLVIGESGFNDTPQTEPKIISRDILDYDSADSDASGIDEIDPGAWSASVNLPVSGAIDDDAAVTDGRFATIDKQTGQIYFFDADSAPGDVYVFDPVTGSIDYAELDGVNHFLIEHGVLFVTRGDADDDGDVDVDDVDEFQAVDNDPTRGGLVASAVGEEWFDLTGDGVLDLDVDTVGSDADVLIHEILMTEFGDVNLDGNVDGLDANIISANFLQAGSFSDGDANFDGVINGLDANIVSANFLFMAGDATAIPEPASFISLAVGLMLVFGGRRRRVA